MNIKRKKSKDRRDIHQFKEGTVFEDGDGLLYIKVYEIEGYNAVKLDNGEHVWFEDWQICLPVECELVVK